jgi:uncharacterized protein (DUF983 family)
MPEASPQTDRPLRPALLHGLRGHCPQCGQGALFDRFLKPADQCAVCAESFAGHEAHDFPAYIVILLLGHIIVGTMISVNAAFDIPVGWQAILWPTVTFILAIALIQPVKGAVITYQWARRMHGFTG